MNGKRKLMALLLTFCLLAYATALAGGAPSSQFGFKGWPYRQNNSCTAICPSATPPVTPAPTEVPTPEPTVTPSETEVPPFTDEDYTTGSITAQEENAFLLLNQDRAANGRSALELDPALCDLARLKSRDMYLNNYFSHTSPTYGSAAQMLSTYGYSFTSVGENIAHHATVEKAQAAFMSSSGHRQNILGSPGRTGEQCHHTSILSPENIWIQHTGTQQTRKGDIPGVYSTDVLIILCLLLKINGVVEPTEQFA